MSTNYTDRITALNNWKNEIRDNVKQSSRLIYQEGLVIEKLNQVMSEIDIELELINDGTFETSKKKAKTMIKNELKHLDKGTVDHDRAKEMLKTIDDDMYLKERIIEAVTNRKQPVEDFMPYLDGVKHSLNS